MANSIFIEKISKQTVKNKDISRIDQLMTLFKDRPSVGKNAIAIAFDYNDVPEEIFQIQEVREWVSLVFAKYPHFLYYCNITPYDTDDTMIFCLTDVGYVAFEGEYISQDEYLAKYGDLPVNQKVVIQTTNILEPIEKCLFAINAYGKENDIEKLTDGVIHELVSKWSARLKGER